MFAHWKKFVIASLAATALGTASLAAPTGLAQFDPATVAATISVGFDDSSDVSVIIAASRLLDAGQLIRVDYGAVSLDKLLKIKSVAAPEGITVSMSDCSLAANEHERGLSLEFEVSNDRYNGGNFPVQVVLENTETGATTTLNLIVQAQ
jgi:type 1 fimbria pilin